MSSISRPDRERSDPAERADDAGGDGVLKAEGVADRDDQLAGPQGLRSPKRTAVGPRR